MSKNENELKNLKENKDIKELNEQLIQTMNSPIIVNGQPTPNFDKLHDLISKGASVYYKSPGGKSYAEWALEASPENFKRLMRDLPVAFMLVANTNLFHAHLDGKYSEETLKSYILTFFEENYSKKEMHDILSRHKALDWLLLNQKIDINELKKIISLYPKEKLLEDLNKSDINSSYFQAAVVSISAHKDKLLYLFENVFKSKDEKLKILLKPDEQGSNLIEKILAVYSKDYTEDSLAILKSALKGMDKKEITDLLRNQMLQSNNNALRKPIFRNVSFRSIKAIAEFAKKHYDLNLFDVNFLKQNPDLFFSLFDTKLAADPARIPLSLFTTNKWLENLDAKECTELFQTVFRHLPATDPSDFDAMIKTMNAAFDRYWNISYSPKFIENMKLMKTELIRYLQKESDIKLLFKYSDNLGGDLISKFPLFHTIITGSLSDKDYRKDIEMLDAIFKRSHLPTFLELNALDANDALKKLTKFVPPVAAAFLQQSISEAKAREEAAFRKAVNDRESSMDRSLVTTAKVHFDNVVRKHFNDPKKVKRTFDSFGKDYKERLEAIEREIRKTLLDRIVANFENSKNKAEKKVALEIIQTNRHKLIAGDKSALALLRPYIDSKTNDDQIAWRAYDPYAPVHSWTNLLALNPEKMSFLAFDFSGVFDVDDEKDASNICRERAAYYFLSAIDDSGTTEEQAERMEQFVACVSDIRRAHSNDDPKNRTKMDDPSCFPGHIGRIAQMGAKHPVARMPKPPKEIIQEVMTEAIVDTFRKVIAGMKSTKEKEKLREALVNLSERSVDDILRQRATPFKLDAEHLRLRNLFMQELMLDATSLQQAQTRIFQEHGLGWKAEFDLYRNAIIMNPGGGTIALRLSNLIPVTDRIASPQPLELKTEKDKVVVLKIPMLARDYGGFAKDEVFKDVAMKQRKKSAGAAHLFSVIHPLLKDKFKGEKEGLLHKFSEDLSKDLILGQELNNDAFRKAIQALQHSEDPSVKNLATKLLSKENELFLESSLKTLKNERQRQLDLEEKVEKIYESLKTSFNKVHPYSLWEFSKKFITENQTKPLDILLKDKDTLNKQCVENRQKAMEEDLVDTITGAYDIKENQWLSKFAHRCIERLFSKTITDPKELIEIVLTNHGKEMDMDLKSMRDILSQKEVNDAFKVWLQENAKEKEIYSYSSPKAKADKEAKEVEDLPQTRPRRGNLDSDYNDFSSTRRRR